MDIAFFADKEMTNDFFSLCGGVLRFIVLRGWSVREVSDICSGFTCFHQKGNENISFQVNRS